MLEDRTPHVHAARTNTTSMMHKTTVQMPTNQPLTTSKMIFVVNYNKNNHVSYMYAVIL